MAEGRRRRRAETAGRLAELATAILLSLKGYRVRARRLRTPVGELDLVARRGDTIAFVEVKLRRDRQLADEAVTPRNRRRLVAAAQWWLAANPEYVGYVLRFDIVLWVPWAWPKHVVDAFDSV